MTGNSNPIPIKQDSAAKADSGTVKKKDFEQILQKRAKRLARESKKKTNGNQIDFVRFSLAGEKYGIESKWVQEVIPVDTITSLPGTPPFVTGIISLRGEILSVVDLKSFFKLASKSHGQTVIVIHSDDMAFGVLVDKVDGVQRTLEKKLQMTLPTLDGLLKDYLKGITEDRTILLNGESILNDPRLIVNEEA